LSIPDRVVVPSGVPGRTKSERVQAMFGRIVARYDLMNRLMTFGQDASWRRAAIADLEPAGALVLDIGAGTGDLALGALKAGALRVVGVDFVDSMLASARTKLLSAGYRNRIAFAIGDALSLPFPDASFDGVVNGFLLRNVADLDGALREFARVLRPGGRLVCLEITHAPPALAPFFAVYFGRIIPILGSIVTGESAAYQYLPESLAPLPNPDHLSSMLRESGFDRVSYRRLGLGTVAIHVAVRAFNE
ncbi:MAG TPA: ubiquinone/menaquinone biosynthesis methyltransferase, partial [Chloroflexota bacterium]|nr:ubiquinone/menaquinone biosynthesis methyltransferase [Chloroflexota bacterium]